MTEITKQDCEIKVARCTAKLIKDHPFYASLFLGMVRKYNPEVKTMGVDGVSIFIAPQFLMDLTDDQCVNVFLHELGHVIHMHHLRRGKRDAKKWNIAGDYVINGEHVTMVPTYAETIAALKLLLDSQYDDMTTEEVYRVLPEPDEGDAGQDQSDPDGQPGPNDPKGSPEPSSGDWDDIPENAKNLEAGAVMDQTDDAGKPVEGTAKAGEEAKLRQRILKAAMGARTQGSLPQAVKELIESNANPKIDWREELPDLVGAANPADSTFARPDRRFLGMNDVRPGPTREGFKCLVIGCDTSYSLSLEELGAFSPEMGAIIEDLQPDEVHVIYCDTKVHRVDTFEAGEDFVMNAHGRGGTRFTPVFDYVEEHDLQPDALVYFTDLGCSDYPDDPGYPVIWAATERATKPPFGDVIDIDLN